MAYYIAADVGCLAIGFLIKWLAGRGFSVHRRGWRRSWLVRS